jgi:para-aminobenzoate synthetase component 1
MSLLIKAKPIQADSPLLMNGLRHMSQAVFLDSANTRERYSFLGYDPTEVLVIENDQLSHFFLGKTEKKMVDLKGLHPFNPVLKMDRTIQKHLNAFLSPRDHQIKYENDSISQTWQKTPPPFFGGAMGYIGYNAFDTVTGLGSPSPLPSLWLGFFSQCIVIDHSTNTAMHYAIETALREPQGPLLRPEALEGPPPYHLGQPQWAMTQAEFEAAVRRGQQHIYEGDCYQLNLSHRISRPFTGDPVSLYADMRRQDPQPFGALIKTKYGHILSFSPEQFFQVSNGQISTSPIKGTAKRSADPTEDAHVAETLRHCTKNDAELMMIVDLLRNDIGQCCEIGSVSVPVPKELHSFAHVHHLMGTITGTLRQDSTPSTLLHAMFPGGSITGAPKHRVRELIAEIETVPRHVYTGSIGYWGLGGHVNTSIAIRTCYQEGDMMHYHTGAGITADSDPTAEWEETLAKAKGFLNA